jgi:hypothetical protein
MKTMGYRALGDVLSMSASAVCTLHCILLPLVVTTLPLFGFELLENIWLEIATLLVSAVAGGWAIWRGFRHYGAPVRWMIWFGAGFACMLLGNWAAAGWVEMTLKGIGAALIVVAHIGNLRHCRHAPCRSTAQTNG